MNGFSVCNKLKRDRGAEGRAAHHHEQRVERGDVRAAPPPADARRGLRPQADLLRRHRSTEPAPSCPRSRLTGRPPPTAEESPAESIGDLVIEDEVVIEEDLEIDEAPQSLVIEEVVASVEAPPEIVARS